MIKQSMPLIERSDFDYIRQIVTTGQIAGGEFVETLQREFAGAIGVRHSFATSSGTAALHLALLALGIKERDEVVIPSYACTALLNAVNYTRAIPVLADVDPETFNLTPGTIKGKISRDTKAIIVTHTFGFPADLDEILKLGVPVIEDCAHSIGSLYKGRPTGTKGKVSVFSFYASKMLSSGEGGMVSTADSKLAERICDLSRPDMRDDYRVRYNYKMSDLTAGLALSQLRKIDRFVQRRIAIAKRYREDFSRLPLSFQKVLPTNMPNYYRFVICAPRSKEIIGFTQKRQVICDRPVYKPLHRYLHHGKNVDYRGSDFLWRNAVSVPIYPALKDGQVSEIIKTVLAAFKNLK